MAPDPTPLLKRSTANDTIVQIKGELVAPEVIAGQSMEQAAATILRSWRKELLIRDPDSELKLVSLDRDRLGYSHLRFAQNYRGIPVWKAALSIHFNPQQQPYLLNGAYYPTPEIGIEGGMDEDAALRSAATLDRAVTRPDYTARRIVFFQEERRPLLAWELEPRGRAALRGATYIIDALTGGLLLRQPARLPPRKHQ